MVQIVGSKVPFHQDIILIYIHESDQPTRIPLVRCKNSHCPLLNSFMVPRVGINIKLMVFRSTDHEGYERVGRQPGEQLYPFHTTELRIHHLPNPMKRPTVNEIRDPRFPIFKEKRRLDICQSSNVIAQFGN